MIIGLVVHAVNLPNELARLQESLSELGPVMECVKTCFITDKDYHATTKGADPDLTKFNPAAAKNLGIRRLLKQGVDGVVCIDADYIVGPGVFDFLLTKTAQPYHIWIRRRDITLEQARPRQWKEWLKLKVFPDCWGSLNYMSKQNWLRMGGWDERSIGWGGDDDLLHLKAGKAGIERRRIDMLPIMHIAHAYRPWSGVNARGQENLKLAQVEPPNYLADYEKEPVP